MNPERAQEILRHSPPIFGRRRQRRGGGEYKAIQLTLPAAYIECLHACAEYVGLSVASCLRRGAEQLLKEKGCKRPLLDALMYEANRIQDRPYDSAARRRYTGDKINDRS